MASSSLSLSPSPSSSSVSAARLMVTCGAGDDDNGAVRLWDLSAPAESSCLASVAPHTGAVRCVRFSPNNQFVVSGGDDGMLVFSRVNGAMVKQLGDPSSQQPIHSLCFSTVGRYVCSGGVDRHVCVWDLKRQERVRVFSGHTAPITAVTYGGSNDEIIASSGSNGHLLLFSVNTNAKASQLPVESTQMINDLAFSSLRRSILASAGDDGSVFVWDVLRKQAIASFVRQHQAPASSVVYSPIHKELLASVGLDKKFIFYDLASNRTVKSISTKAPLSCVDFEKGGIHIAAGTSQGDVLLYDLRSSEAPYQIISAHPGGSVACLRFQCGEMRKDSRRTAAAKDGVSSTPRSESSASVAPTPAQPRHPPAPSAPELLSPVREVRKPTGQPDANTTGRDSIFVSFHSPIPASRPSMADASFISNQPSPSADLSLAVSPPSKPSFAEPPTSLHAALPLSSSLSPFPSHHLQQATAAAPIISSSSSAFSKREALSPLGSSSTSSPPPPKHLRKSSSSGALAPTPAPAKKSAPSVSNGVGVSATATAPTASSALPPVSERGSNLDLANVHSDPLDTPDVGRIQSQYLRSIIDESIAALRNSLREDINNLHIELLRQFHIQSLDTASQLEMFAQKYESLLEEVRGLREAYDTLTQ